MKSNVKTMIAISAFLVCQSTILYAENVEVLFASMRDSTYTQDFSKNIGFPELCWSDIPELLEKAHSTQHVTKFPINVISSAISVSHTEGMVALWLIEGLRVGNRFPSLQPVIIKQGKRKRRPQPDKEYQKEIRLLYEQWWKNVKDMPQKEVCSINPLKDSCYKWF